MSIEFRSSTRFRYLSISSTCQGDWSIDTGFIDMSFDPARRYNDLPSLPPSQDVETKAVLKACVEARAALAELKSPAN